MERRPRYGAELVAGVYALVGAAWIVGGHFLTTELYGPSGAGRFELAKGLAYVAVTALALLGACHYTSRRAERLPAGGDAADLATLHRRVVAIAAGLVLLVFAALAAGLYQMRIDAVREAEEDARDRGRLLAEQVSRTIQSVDLMLEGLAADPRLYQPPTPEATAEIRALLERRATQSGFVRAFWVLDAKGRLVHSILPQGHGESFDERTYFRVHRSTPDAGLFIGRPVDSRVTGEVIMPLSRGLRDRDGQFQGVVVASVPASHFAALWPGAATEPGGTVALFRSDGTLVLRRPAASASVGQSFRATPLFARRLAEAPSGVFWARSIVDGGEKVFAYRRLAPYADLVVLVGVARDAALASWRQYTALAAGSWLLLVALVAVLVSALLRQAGARLRAFAALRESELRHRRLFAQIGDAVFITDDAAGTILDANPAAERLVGASVGELLGSPFGALIRPPDGAVGEQDLFDTLVRRRDGAAVPVDLSAGSLGERDGAPMTVRVLRDVSERRRAAAALRETTMALLEAQRIGNLGTWTWRMGDAGVVWSDEMFRIHAIAPRIAPVGPADAFVHLPSPERETLEAAVRRILIHGGSFDLTHRVFAADGTERIVRTRAEAVREGDGRVVGLFGTSQDATESTRQAEIVASLARFPAENPNPVLRYDLAGNVLHANAAARRFLAAVAAPEAGRDRAWGAAVAAATAPGAPREFLFAVAGRTYMFDVAPRTGTDVSLYGRDVTELRHQARQLQLQAAAMQAASNAMFITDAEGRIEWMNDAFERMSGFGRDDALGRTPRILKSGRTPPVVYERLWRTILSGHVWRERLVNRRKDGALYHVDQTITPITGDGGEIEHFVVVHDDVTEQVEAEARLHHLALHDPLTGLPNRMAFLQIASTALMRARSRGSAVAVLLLDLDHFKNVNDALGHAAGDDLLSQVAERAGLTLRGGDVIARLGGDEFAVLLEDIQQPEHVAVGADRLLDVLRSPFDVGGTAVSVGASIGITVFPADDADAETLLKHADLAMYEAKSNGRNRYSFFEAAMDEGVRRRLELETGLRQALAGSQFVVHFQPQFSIATGTLVGAEALVRWRHPERGEIRPAEFIPVAEHAGLIGDIGEWVLREVLARQRGWRDAGLPAVRVAVNFSASQFERADLADYLHRLVQDAGLQLDAIEAEITESVMMRRSAVIAGNLLALDAAGVAVSVDDFGTGYSSLLYLREFPLRRLKIDLSFVQGIGRNSRDEQIVRAVIGLGHQLGLRVIAEGVETPEQLAFLHAERCDEAQGYIFARPMTAEAFAAFLADPAAAVPGAAGPGRIPG